MRRVMSEAMRAALRSGEPSKEQWEVIDADLVPVAIVAGAGTGKTAVMAARIVSLVERGLVRPPAVLGLTFTNKAAAELESRIAEALAHLTPRPTELPTITTYHAFATQLVREHGPRIGIDSDAALLTEAQKWQLLMRLVDDLPRLEKLELRHPLSFIPQTLKLADALANHLATADDLEQASSNLARSVTNERDQDSLEKRADLAKIIACYEQKKRELRRIDYGDQIRLAVRILEEHPDVGVALRERYPVVLLDEYQDTNPAQKVMLQHLCPPGWAVTAVGDARQTIYTWRGASMFNLIHFTKEFPDRDGRPSRQESLSLNFRSGRRIVELANRIIERVAPERRPGADLVAFGPNGEAWVGAALFTDQEAEAAFIAEEVERLHAGGRKWRDIAILVRKKRYMDRIYAALQARDIPVETPDLGGLLCVPPVVDTVAWLRVLNDPGPSTNRWAARILMGPRFRIHYRDLAPIARHAVESNTRLREEAAAAHPVPDLDPGEVAYSLVEALRADVPGTSPEARERIGEFLALLDELKSFTRRSLHELVQTVIDRTGIGEALVASTSRAAPSMREHLEAFIGVCAEFAPLEGTADLETFVDYLDASEASEDPIPVSTTVASDSVKLMTVHAAKGLEFDTVFLPVLAASPEVNRFDGYRKGSVFPDVRAASPLSSVTELPTPVRRDRDDLPQPRRRTVDYIRDLKERAEEDERRLFYVGITRAKQRLYCTAAHWYGTNERKGPSIFWDEIRDASDLVELVRCDEAPAENPAVDAARHELHWPPPAAYSPATLEWMRIVDNLRLGALDPDQLVDEHGARDLYERHLEMIDSFLRSEQGVPPTGGQTRSYPATTFVRLGTRKEGSEEAVLPEPPTPEQRLGTEVHAWIEELHRGLIGLAEEDAVDSPPGPADGRSVALLKEHFREMGFERRRPLTLPSGEPASELPFTLKMGDGLLVRGRIDVVYEDGEELEVVDFKTGEEPVEPDWAQLELYAEALAQLGIARGPLKLTLAYLRTGRTRSKRYTPQGLGRFAAQIEAALA